MTPRMLTTDDSILRDHTARLPVEIFLYVLDNLRQPDVLHAARVSRRWRSFAVIHRYYYAFIFFWTPASAPWSTDADFRVSEFRQTLRRCKQRGVRLALDIDVERDPGRWILDGDIQREYNWLGDELRCDPVVELVLPALTDVLSLVFRLRIRAHPGHEYPKSVYSALRGAAPLLEHLELDLSDESGRFEMDSPPPPQDLFAYNAPRLRTVLLCDTALPDTPIPALLLADDVDLQFISQPPLSRITACFPGSVSLRIRCGAHIIGAQESPGTVASFNPVLQTLKLHVGHVSQEYPEDLCAALKREYIPHVELGIFRHAPDICPVLGHLPEYLSLALQTSEDSGPTHDGRMVLTQADVRSPTPFTRAFDFKDYQFKEPRMRPQLLRLNHRLVCVDTAYKYLESFVYTLKSLPELTTLTIAVTDSPYVDFWLMGYMSYPRRIIPLFSDGSEARQSASEAQQTAWELPFDAICEGGRTLDCPKLTRINLRAAGAYTTTIDTHGLLHLARDLSLLRSKNNPSATLGLEGITLEGRQHTGLFSMFSNYA